MLLIPLILVLNSCGENGTVPIQLEQLKDPREMTWTVDTIYYPGAFQTLMNNFCAFSSKNIYVVGHSSQGSAGSLYHFNGEKWEEVNYNVRGILFRITGIDNELWGAGYIGTEVYGVYTEYSHVVKYDGSIWQEINFDNSSHLITVGALLSITAESKNNIWACGREGLVIHYNGSKWQKDTINIPRIPNTEYSLYSIILNNGKPLIMGLMYNPTYGIKTYYITGNENNWTVTDSMHPGPQNPVTTLGDNDFHKGDNGKLYSFGDALFEYNAGIWKNIYSTENYIDGMKALREDYIFVVGHFGLISFYDGKSWDRLTELEAKIPGALYKDVWTDGKEVFIVGYLNTIPQKSIVLHGK